MTRADVQSLKKNSGGEIADTGPLYVSISDQDPFDGDVPWEALTEHIRGDASSRERPSVMRWIAGHPERAERIEVLRSAVRNMRGRREAQARASWARFIAHRDRGQRTAANVWPRTRGRGATNTNIHRIYGLGAVLMFVIVAVVTWHSGRDRTTVQDRLGPRMTRQYHASAGQLINVTLNDGSRVTLMPSSTLAVDDRFGEHSRRAWLTGEAYFDVIATHRLPFIVQSGVANIRVLGTSFIIRHEHGSRPVHVAVLNGKVSLTSTMEDQSARVQLTSGMVGAIVDSAPMLTRESAQTYAAWTTGRLVFQEVPAIQVTATLSRWYGYRVIFTDSTMASQRITIGLSAQSATDALATLRTVLDADVTVDAHDKTLVMIQPRRTTRHPLLNPDQQPSVFKTPFTREIGR